MTCLHISFLTLHSFLSPQLQVHLFVVGRPNSTEEVPDSSAGVLTRNKTHCELCDALAKAQMELDVNALDAVLTF
jgi:hypothetical protein